MFRACVSADAKLTGRRKCDDRHACLCYHACLAALELCVAPPDSPTGSSKGGRPCSPGPSPTAHAASTKKWFVSGTKAAQGVEGFLDSLTRNGYLTAPPTEFLALMTDWHSARTNNSAQQE